MALVFRLGVVCPLLAIATICLSSDIKSSIKEAFSQMASLKDMQPGVDYELPIRGHVEKGPKELYLRRRTSDPLSP